MILKIILGSGGRGLVSYLSQPSKAPIHHHPQNKHNIHAAIHVAHPNLHPSKRAEPATSTDRLQKLHQLNVVHSAREPIRFGQRVESVSEMFLQGDALPDLVGRAANDAAGVRRPGNEPGTAPAQKSGGRRLENKSSPPTFSTFAGTTPRQIASEFGQLRKLKPNLGKAAAHLILSPGPGDRKLSMEEWKKALDMALAEHGAKDAPHAAWLHSDTNLPHLHCFFSRITHTGEVISDSLSYQKNRSASQKITQELHLTPISETPNPAASANRAASQNTTRRADRRGDDAVNAADIRAAVAIAIDLADLERRLAEIGVEAEFQKRGQEQVVYGWKVRKIGQVEWLKASTLAKDLSWPKIEHRFAEPDSAEELPTNNAAQSVQAPRTPDEPNKYDRAPAMLRQSLVRQSKPGALDFDLAAARKNIWSDEVLAGPAKAILEIGFIAMKLGAEALKALLQLVQWILRKMGFGTAAAPAGSDQAKTPLPFLPVIDVDSRFLPGPDGLKLRADKATDQLEKVAAALRNNDAGLLPEGEGRAELAATLTAERTPFSVPSAADKTVDFFVGSKNKQQSVGAAVEATTAELVDQFKSEVATHQAAAAALKKTTAPNFKSLPFYLSRTQRANEESEIASVEADSAEKEYLDWKAKNRLVSVLVDPFGLKKRAEEAREIAKKYATALAKSQAEDATFSRRAASLPPREAPPEIVATTAAAGDRGRQTWARLKAQIHEEILAAKAADPMLGARLDVLLAKLDRTRPTGLADPVKSVSFFNEFDSLCHEFLSAKAASFVLNQRVDSDFEEQVEKPSVPK